MSNPPSRITKRIEYVVVQDDNLGVPKPPIVDFDSPGSAHTGHYGTVEVLLHTDAPVGAGGAQVPFIAIASTGMVFLERDVDYEIVDFEGTRLTKDVIVIPSGSTEGTLFVRSLPGAILGGIEAVIFRLVASHSNGLLTGAILGPQRDHTFEVYGQTGPPGNPGDPGADPPARTIAWVSLSGTANEGNTTFTRNIPIRLSSVAPVGGCQVSIQAIGNAVPGEQYVLLTPTVSIPEGEANGLAQVSIVANNIFHGTRTVRLILQNPVNCTLGTPQVHTLTITDNDLPGTGPVWRVAPSSAGGVQIIEGGGQGIVLLEVSNGVPSTAPVSLAWSVQGTGSNPAVLGIDYFQESNNPVIVPAGIGTAAVRFSAAADTTVEGNRTALLTLVSATGSQASVGTPNTAPLTVVDTSNQALTASWQVSGGSLIEGAPAVGVVCNLSAPAPSGLAVNVLVQGTAQLGDFTVQWPGGTPGVMQFAPGATSAQLLVMATLDTTPEVGETVIFRLAVGTGYTIGTPNFTTWTIFDQVTGDTLIEYDVVPGVVNPVISFCTGIDPTPPNQLPIMYLDGREATLLPIDAGRADGLVRAVEVIGVANNSGVSIVKTTGLPSQNPSIVGINLNSAIFEGYTANEPNAPYRASFSDAVLVEIVQECALKRVTLLWIPFKRFPQSTAHLNTCGGFHVMLTQYAGRDMYEVDMVYRTDLYDLSQPMLSGSHPYATGDVHIQSIGLYGMPNGYRIVAHYEDPSMNLAAPGNYLLKPGPAIGGGFTKSHIIPAGMKLHRRFGIVHSSITDDTAKAWLEGKGHGVAIQGPFSAFQRRWMGSQLEYVPNLDSPHYTYNSGGNIVTGRAACRARSARYLARILDTAQTGVSMGEFWRGAQGEAGTWWMPFSYDFSGAGSGVGIHKRHGYHMVREELTLGRIAMSYLVQRDQTGMIGAASGVIHRAEAIASHYGGQYPLSPEPGHPQGGNWELVNPQWQKPGYGSNSDLHLAPTTKPWNTPQGTVPPVEDVRIEPFGPTTPGGTAQYSWGTHTHTHFMRKYHLLVMLAWVWNDPMAQWILREDAAYIERVMPHIPAAAQDTYLRDSFGLADSQRVIVAANRQEWGGFYSPVGASGYNIAWGRGAAHAIDAHAYGACFEKLGTAAKDECIRWSEALEHTFGLVANNWGGAYRETGVLPGGGAYPYDHLAFPGMLSGTDLGSGQTQSWWANPLPDGWTASQGWQGMYMALGLLGEALTNGVHPNALNHRCHSRRGVVGLTQAVFRPASEGGSRPDSAPLAPDWTISSNGTLGTDDPSNPVPVPYEFIPNPNHPNPGGIPFPYADHRFGVGFACSLHWLLEENDAAGVAEMLRLAKRSVELPETASNAAFADKLMQLMSLDGDGSGGETHRVYGGGYAALLGEIQHIP